MVITGATVNPTKNTSADSIIQRNKGFQSLLDYEKKHLIPLNDLFEENDKDLTELERNFLEGRFFFKKLCGSAQNIIFFCF